MDKQKGSSNHKKIEHLIKHNRVIQKLYVFFASAFFRFIGLFIRVKEDIVLMNGHGYRYNDSPRAIFEKMIKLGLDKKYKVIWALNDITNVEISSAFKIVRMDTFEYFKCALMAKYWISCVNIERGLKFKKRKTIYLNTWHGASLNYVGNAVSGRKDFDFRHIDYFCYNGEYERDFIKRDFRVRDEALIPTGYPRNDELYYATDKTKNMLRKKIGIPEGKKVILYAPTWRESDDGGNSFKLIPPIDWKKWEEQLGKKFVVLLRTHPYTTELMNVAFNDFVRDYTDYPKVNDLLIIADVLISDYSCIQLDYSILAKPQICFGYDYDDYKLQRGFYFDLEKTMPNGVLKDEDSVIELLLNMNYENECRKSEKFRNEHMQYGGNASIKCINLIFKTNFKEEKNIE